MLLSLSLCWLGTGAWLLADTRRLQRLWPLEPSSQRSSSLRALGLALLLLAAAPLVRREGLALGSVALAVLLPRDIAAGLTWVAGFLGLV